MDVQIFDCKNQKKVAVFTISLKGLNYQPTEAELFDEAWKCAIEDKLVDINRKFDYQFKLIE